MNSPHKCHWRGALVFSLICPRINGWVNNGEAGDLRRYRTHYDIMVMNQLLAGIGSDNGLVLNWRQSIHYLVQRLPNLLTHICVTRPRWFNQSNPSHIPMTSRQSLLWNLCWILYRFYISFNSSDAGNGIFWLWVSILYLLLLWLLKSPEHQQAWYWLCSYWSFFPMTLWHWLQMTDVVFRPRVTICDVRVIINRMRLCSVGGHMLLWKHILVWQMCPTIINNMLFLKIFCPHIDGKCHATKTYVASCNPMFVRMPSACMVNGRPGGHNSNH